MYRKMSTIDLGRVEYLLSQRFSTEVKIQDNQTLGGGCISHASKLITNAGAFFMKWNSSCASDTFIREAEGLKALRKAGKDKILVPETYVATEPGEQPGLLIQQYFAPGSADLGKDEQLGRGLAQIHKNTNDRFGFFNNNYCGDTPQLNEWKDNWLEFFRENRLKFLLNMIQSRYELSVEILRLFDNLSLRLEAIIPTESKPALIHGDLWSGNYLYTRESVALIDPAAYYADREMEFSILTMFGGFSDTFFAAYQEVYPLPEDWYERNKLYQIYHYLNHYFLFGGHYLNQAVGIARRYL